MHNTAKSTQIESSSTFTQQFILNQFLQDKIVVVENTRRIFVACKEIVYFKAQRSSTELHTRNGKIYVMSANIGSIAAQLQEHKTGQFLRVHKSYL